MADSVALVGARAAAAETYQLAAASIARVPPGAQVEAKRLRAELHALAGRARESRSEESLREVEAVGADTLASAGELADRLAVERRQAAAAAEQTGRRNKLDRDAERDRRARQKAWERKDRQQRAAFEQDRKARLRRLDRLAARRRTSPGEDVVAILVDAEVVARRDRIVEKTHSGRWARLTGRDGEVERIRRTTWVDVRGQERTAAQLAAWNTGPVLEAIAAARADIEAAAPPVDRLLALMPGPSIYDQPGFAGAIDAASRPASRQIDRRRPGIPLRTEP